MHELALGKDFPIKLIPLIKQARQSIDIIVYDWRWYADQVGSINQKFNQEIGAASRRGVKVRALLNSEQIIAPLRVFDIEARRIPSGKQLHTKLMVIDRKISILGSHNYTKNAFSINFEASIIIEDEQTAQEFTTYFENLFII